MTVFDSSWMQAMLERWGLAGLAEELLGVLRHSLGLDAEDSRSASSSAPAAPVSEPAPEPVTAVMAEPPSGPSESAAPKKAPAASRSRKKAGAPKAKDSTPPEDEASPKAHGKARGSKRASTAEVDAPPPSSAKKARSPKRPVAPQPSAPPSSSEQAAEPAKASDVAAAVERLMAVVRTHPRHEELVAAGRRKDQLLRSLIPFYLARSLELDVTSGTISRFWKELGVAYAAPNAAKALRLHVGHIRAGKKGKSLTPKGVRYVEEALEKQRETPSSAG